jgi:TRAP transporter TAXI family solute receptor
MLNIAKAFIASSALWFILSGLALAQSVFPAPADNAPEWQPIQLAQAATGNAPAVSDAVADLNANTVTIISGNPNGTYLYLAYDFSAVLDDGDNLRVLPIVGKGGAQNTKDVLYLKGIDMGITQSAVLRYYNKTGEVGRNIANRLRYITRLYNEEMHLLVAPDINSIQDLRGKKVNFSDAGSGTQLSSVLIFDYLGIPVEEVNMGQGDAIEAIRRDEIAATVLIAGKPSGAYARLQANPDQYKLIGIPYTAELQEEYLPAVLTHADYPNLIPEGQQIDTIAASAVLAVFNWSADTDRYRRVAKFTKAFFENFDKFLEKPRHPKWKEVNLAAELPGWTRFAPAQELLDQAPVATGAADQDRLKTEFTRFLNNLPQNEDAAGLSDDRREELFRKFLEWQGQAEQ